MKHFKGKSTSLPFSETDIFTQMPCGSWRIDDTRTYSEGQDVAQPVVCMSDMHNTTDAQHSTNQARTYDCKTLEVELVTLIFSRSTF